jgi:hypothetical protein
VFGVDFVIRAHPGVNGVLDVEIVGWRHDNRRLWLTHTRDEYSANYKERIFVIKENVPFGLGRRGWF